MGFRPNIEDINCLSSKFTLPHNFQFISPVLHFMKINLYL